MNKEIISRTVPFATFMTFIGANELLQFLDNKGIIDFPPNLHLYLYPARIVVVALLMAFFWKQFDEIRCRDLLNVRNTILSITVGIVVFVLWINMPWTLVTSGSPVGYNPTAVSENFTHFSLIGFRLLGATVVVPIMEELFWRSFVMRYIINPEFSDVPVGRFTWPSFLIGSILFGLEHHLLLAGIMAGVAYNLLLYRIKSIACCILAHGITNILLGAYILQTHNWNLW